MKFAYKRVTRNSFDETVIAVERSAVERGLVVLQSHDIQAALAAKGFDINPLRIMQVGPQEDPTGVEALLLPVRINVYVEDEHTVVAALRPTLFTAVFPEHDLDSAAEDIERRVTEVVDAAVGGSLS